MTAFASSRLRAFMRWLSFVSLYLFAGALPAQKNARTATLHGIVAGPIGGIEGAVVELFSDAGPHLVVSTTASGAFEFAAVPAGDYHVRVRRIGFAMAEQTIVLNGPRDSVRVELGDNSHLRDSLLHLDYVRRLAAARARPRHWDCSVPSREVESEAKRAFSYLVPVPEKDSGWHYPRSWEAFRRDFRPIRDNAECRRIAEALDREHGLAEDEISIFRVGRIYFLPAFGPMVVSLEGKVLSVFVIPN